LAAAVLVGYADEFRRSDADALLALAHVSDPTGYGIATVDDSGIVTAVAEKPRRPESDLALTGVYFFRPRVHEAIACIEPSPRGELEITDAIQWLIAAGADIRARVHAGYWKDTGRVDDLLDCNQVCLRQVSSTVIAGSLDAASRLSGPVVVEPGARVRGSHLRGPVIVGARSTIINSVVGPFTSLGSDCLVVDAELERSIVLDGACVRRAGRVACSIIGRSAHVAGAPAGTSAHRLIIGDDCHVVIGGS
jgi:glucose-1-phosphate thymidylyltransferase